MNTMPAGKYYLGDPCYVIDDNRWGEFLEEFRGQDPRGKFDFDGLWCCAFNTEHGDGQYALEPEGTILLVDAGIIGVIPMALVQGTGDYGCIVEFDAPFNCQAVNGTLYFDGHKVNTTWEDDDEEEDRCEHCGY